MNQMPNKLTLKQLKQQLAAIKDPTDSLLSALKSDDRVGVQKLLQQWHTTYDQKCAREERFRHMRHYEEHYLNKGATKVVGVDEVGRGPLAGPVVVAAVALPGDIVDVGLDDSKRLSHSKRAELVNWIKKEAIAYKIVAKDSKVIDHYNILEATRMAMTEAVMAIADDQTVVLTDAMKLPISLKQIDLIKGDQRSVSIAAASILAKEYRDGLMKEYAELYPHYDFQHNMGYGTKKHLQGLSLYGATPIHRLSFSPVMTSVQSLRSNKGIK